MYCTVLEAKYLLSKCALNSWVCYKGNKISCSDSFFRVHRKLNSICCLTAVIYLINHSLIHSLTHSLNLSLTYSLTHSLTRSLTQSLAHSLTHPYCFVVPGNSYILMGQVDEEGRGTLAPGSFTAPYKAPHHKILNNISNQPCWPLHCPRQPHRTASLAENSEVCLDWSSLGMENKP